ncbi:diguanylate cyclase (GGDEF) domain-containing protein [Cohaesibacter marisflavi]|uniref:diguanylate cyclase n=1 Tax=Cohaesibacter marisflavi TaxID=655353 RepID=A0A1I5GX55_9HYPH|nr:diguanylate cyclase [Cohaesibacter marisflavi]SFO40527.1 diguanylate cyclase (GGDEF) domain-containing protein [Cohaesibacter marisflavi]
MRIVLVEDNDEDREAIRTILEQRRESVFAFHCGDSAWEFVQKTPDIDVVIVSLNLEDASGLEICWNCRILAAERKAMYVVAISEYTNADMLVEALDSGADDFLHKPLQEDILLARLRVAERVIMLQKQLVQLANRDPMTNLYNRRAFFEKAHALIEKQGDAHPVSAIMFDIDHFKSVNDRFGHDVGDQVIKTVTKIALGESDFIGRLGGEEFAVLIQGQSFFAAACAANRIREMIEHTTIIAEGNKVQITSSFGVARLQEGDDIYALLKRADRALYRSKNNGRNMVTIDRSQAAKRSDISSCCAAQ